LKNSEMYDILVKCKSQCSSLGENLANNAKTFKTFLSCSTGELLINKQSCKQDCYMSCS